MQSNYERTRFRKKYIMLFLFLLAIYILWCKMYGGFTRQTIGGIVLFTVLGLCVYIFSYRELNAAYKEMENISDIMTEIMDSGEDAPIEEYKEGTVGILYSNFYKMVGMLKESKNRELKEKIFLRDIISDISHQLKTPLASLTIFVDLLLEGKIEDKTKQKQILTEAGNQLNRMEWMVLSMLKLARIEAGAILFDKQDTYLDQVILQASEGVQFLLEERNQKLHIDCGEDVRLICDGEWLTEALINLLKNASDYSQEGKNIWIEVEQTNVFTRIYVKDEGVGIPEEELPNIFKRFYRVNQEVNPNSVGIGLALTKSIVEGMGGTIHVKSEEGKYTWFVMTWLKYYEGR